MAQQTAIEWLVDNLPQRFKNAMLINSKEIIEQAKQMEKEQIMDAFYNGTDNRYDGEQYYNETYNK